MSLRARLALVVGLVLVAVIAVVGVVVIETTRDTLVGQVDEQVRVAAMRLESTYNGMPAGGDGAGAGLGDAVQFEPIARYVYGPDGRMLLAKPYGFSDDPKPPPAFGADSTDDLLRNINVVRTVRAVDGSLAYRALVLVDDNGNYVVTAVPLTAASEATQRVMWTMAISGLAAVALAAFASWWVISRELRPIDRIIRTAAAIGDSNLSRRVPESHANTELGHLSRALNRMLDRIEVALRLQERSEAKLRQFIADAAHELRTPLTSLRGYAELYRQGSLDSTERLGQAMGRIEDEGIRMARLLDDMMLLARLDDSRDEHHDEVDLGQIVEEQVRHFQQRDPDREVSADIAPDVCVHGDRGQLRLLVSKLLDNVRVHTPTAARLDVTVREVDGIAELRVHDTGPGMGIEFQARAFDRFTREDPARTRATGGTGMGLAIALAVAELHQGTIRLESAPGSGTAFTVCLPVVERRGDSLSLSSA